MDEDTKLMAFGIGIAIIAVVGWGVFIFGAIYFFFWCLEHFGVIGG